MRIQKILGIALILILDLIIFGFLSLLLMEYDDFYDESKGKYGSFESMTRFQAFVQVLWNVWVWLNVFFFVYLLYRRKKSTIKKP